MKPYHWHTKVQLKQKKLDRNQLWFMATIDTDGSKSPIVINPLQYPGSYDKDVATAIAVDGQNEVDHPGWTWI